jgi:HPr kinase/phosphorylase
MAPGTRPVAPQLPASDEAGSRPSCDGDTGAGVGSAAATLHATTVAHGGRALLIRGPAGSGKSALALELLARGAALVADDRTVLTLEAGRPVASPPPSIAGLIEARGLGLLRLPWLAGVPVAAVADLSQAETERLPPRRTTVLLGREVALFRRVEDARFAPALLMALAHPPIDPDAQLQTPR